MFRNYPKVRTALKTLLHIFAGIVAYIGAIVLANRLVNPIILLLFEREEMEYYALSGLANLIFIYLVYHGFVKWYEKRRAIELKIPGRNIFYGAIAGMAIISITATSLFAVGYYEVIAYQERDEMLLVLVALASQAITSEILFRGILFRIIEKQMGTICALALVSVLLSLLNIVVDGVNLLVLISTLLISALWCSIYILSRNLWVVGLSHSAWLYSVFLTGILDEHWRVSAPIISSYNGPAFITGGEFGPEHSTLTVALVSICLFWTLKTAKNKGLFIKP